jgi:hypothetical protein
VTLPPPQRPHYQGEPSQYRPVQQHHVAAQRQDKAPTLGQYWRSDNRTAPGRKPARWAGRAAFLLGILAAVLLFSGTFFGAPTVVADFAAPVSLVAVVFALIAIIAGVGRGLGIFGLIFALAGSTIFWSWLDRTFG